jgi:hypothetical protein
MLKEPDYGPGILHLEGGLMELSFPAPGETL